MGLHAVVLQAACAAACLARPPRVGSSADHRLRPLPSSAPAPALPQVSHLLQKPIESVCGFLTVLPGAFCAFRWAAVEVRRAAPPAPAPPCRAAPLLAGVPAAARIPAALAAPSQRSPAPRRASRCAATSTACTARRSSTPSRPTCSWRRTASCAWRWWPRRWAPGRAAWCVQPGLSPARVLRREDLARCAWRRRLPTRRASPSAPCPLPPPPPPPLPTQGANYRLEYIKEAVAEADAVTKLTGLMKQRRRWLNGTFFAML